jgi:hypothetical protein
MVKNERKEKAMIKMFIQKFGGNFKPTFWSKYCQTELKKDLVIANWCDYKFEGEIKKGERLKIVGSVKPKVGDYDENTDLEIEKLADNAQYLDIDYANYFAFEVEDVNKAQSTPGYLDTEFNESKTALAEKEDAKVAEVAAKGALTSMKSANTAITVENSLTVIDEALKKLYKNNVDGKTDLAADLTPEHIVDARTKLASLFTENVDYIKNGAVGKYNKVYLRLSNNLYNDGTVTNELIRTKKAVAVANAIDKVETCRKEKGFASIIKGLNVYGIKVVRPKEMYVIKVTNA